MKRCYSCFGAFDDAYTICPHCGRPEIKEPVEPIQLYPGTVLANRYIIGEAVGSGGFGIIYKAWDTKLETVVAVKEFYASRLVNRAAGLKSVIVTKKSQAEFDYRKDRFLAEARNMAKFGSHRSIPNVFEFFEENNTAYIVMELLRGVSLSDYLRQTTGPLDVDFAILITNEIGNALKSLHQEGIIHRDVAPDNIYICSGKDLRIKLLDLGAAKLADSSDDVIDIILKPGYSPTEQYDNSKNIGPWTDLYALGATLYVMLTGIKPDESTNRKIQDSVVPPHMLNPAVSENLSNAIMKAMAVEKHMRFKKIDDFLEALGGQRKVISLSKERRNRSIKRFVGVAAAVAVLAALGGLTLHTYNQKQQEQQLESADISIWYCADEGSDEQAAMEAMIEDFTVTFPDVTVELRAIAADEYLQVLEEAAEKDELPHLFESTGLTDHVLEEARSVSHILRTEQAGNCLFLDQYDDYYSDANQIPLAIEVPMACVITSGAVDVEYSDSYFGDLSDFGTDVNISLDSRYTDLIVPNLGSEGFCDAAQFLNNEENTSPVMLSSTMVINEVRQTLTNYQKTYVYYDSTKIYCRFTYEWSLGEGSDAENAAADKLLTWMLGNVYQSTLMISTCNDGQIPINQICFQSKIEAKNLTPIADIYEKFIFSNKE